MYTLIRSRPLSFLMKETPTLFISVIVAELFFKFGSFTFELVAFFVTWYALSRIACLIKSGKQPNSHTIK